jgi:hypothetical protein
MAKETAAAGRRKMTESLLSHSNVLLFGRVVEELKIKLSPPPVADVTLVTSTQNDITARDVDGVALAEGDKVLVLRGKNRGLYNVPAGPGMNEEPAAWEEVLVVIGTIYHDSRAPAESTGSGLEDSYWRASGSTGKPSFSRVFGPGIKTERPVKNRKGKNQQLEDQLINEGATFARIYAFSFEGAYYELPQPALFLVHGDGDDVTVDNLPPEQASRAPTNPSITGLPAADFQFSNDMKYWSYDKADYTIRMDIESGMFEQVLLDAIFGDDIFGGGMAGATVRGATVRGATVRGATVRGATVRGATVRGATVRGATVRGGGGGD